MEPPLMTEHMYSVYFDWSEYFVKVSPRRAVSYLSKCLEVNPHDVKALHLRSVCKRKLAMIESALADALMAQSIQKDNSIISLEVCDGLFDQNQFENCKIELCNDMRTCVSAIVADFKDRLIVVNETFNDCLGDSLGSFLCKHIKVLHQIAEAIKLKSLVQTRPLWKIRKEQGECDVLSIEEKQEKLLSPMELARRKRRYNIFAQFYFGRNWLDKVFLHDLIHDDKWMPPIFTVSTPYLQKLLKPEFGIVNKFLRMLHARSPMYNEYHKRFGNAKFMKQHREQYLYQKQFQTRREMFTVLQKIKQLRELGRIEEMTKYIEDFMGNIVVLKTSRIMPWKFEFVNEVYNTLGLAHADRYVIPNDFPDETVLSSLDRFKKLLHIENVGKITSIEYVFGDRSTYVSVDDVDHAAEMKKKLISRFEKRMLFAKYPIERCYLYHELARTYFKQNRYDECHSMAKRAIEESKHCNSHLWGFLGAMISVKTYAVQQKLEYCRNALMDAFTAAVSLKNPEILDYLQFATIINENSMISKKNALLAESRRKGSRHTSSFGSLESVRDSDAAREQI